MRLNQPCFEFSDNELRVDYAHLQLSTGPVAPVAVRSAAVEEGKVLSMQFEKNPLHVRCNNTDEVFLYAYSPALGQGYLFNSVYRYTGEVRVLLPEWLFTDDLQLFLMVKDIKGNWSTTAHSEVKSGKWKDESGERKEESGEIVNKTSELKLFSYFCSPFNDSPDGEDIYRNLWLSDEFRRQRGGGGHP